MNAAIIVAAGTGSRFGSDVPKQFLEVAGRPIVAHAISTFERATSIDSVIVVVSEDRVGYATDFLSKNNFTKVTAVAVGGDTRALSVRSGAEQLPEGAQIVLIHDGARPLLNLADIDAVINAARSKGAACLVAPVTETIKRVENGIVDATVDRAPLRRALTPQAFRRDVFEAMMESGDSGLATTDECMLAERLGFEVAAVEGDSANIKVTHPHDLLTVEAFLRSNG